VEFFGGAGIIVAQPLHNPTPYPGSRQGERESVTVAQLSGTFYVGSVKEGTICKGN